MLRLDRADPPETESPYTSQQFDHEQATEDETDDSKGILRLRQALIHRLTLVACVITDKETDQEVRKDTANI